MTGEKLLSLGYGAPEQEIDASRCDARTDVYGLGALLFFALPVAAAWKWERFAVFRWRPAAALVKLARDVAAAVVAVRRGGVAGRVLALSLAVRAA